MNYDPEVIRAFDLMSPQELILFIRRYGEAALPRLKNHSERVRQAKQMRAHGVDEIDPHWGQDKTPTREEMEAVKVDTANQRRRKQAALVEEMSRIMAERQAKYDKHNARHKRRSDAGRGRLKVA